VPYPRWWGRDSLPWGRRMEDEEASEEADPIRARVMHRRLHHSAYCPPQNQGNAYGSDGYCNAYDATAMHTDPDCLETGCHPSDTLLELPSGGTVRIDEVAVGTLVKTASGVEPVTALMHAEPDVTMSFFRFHTKDASMAISKGHWLFVNGIEREPSTVTVGELLTTSCCGAQPITKIEQTVEQGKFHITTPSNNYYADGVLSSTYVSYVPLNVWKVAGGLYPMLRYKLGVPITPEGQGPLSIFWLLYVYQALSLPKLVVDALWPLTMSATLFAELLNTAAVQLPLSVSVLALGAVVSRRLTRK